MAKKVGVAVMGFFVTLVVGINLFTFWNNRNGAGMSGMAIGGGVGGSSVSLSLIAFIGQWVLLLVVVIFGYLRFLRHRKEEEKKVDGFIIPKLTSRAHTHIDLFYDLLEEKKELSTGTIAKAFNLTKEQALNWAKVLEEHGMVSIEYPAIADPEVRIAGYEEELKRKREEEKKRKELEKRNKSKLKNPKNNVSKMGTKPTSLPKKEILPKTEIKPSPMQKILPSIPKQEEVVVVK